MNLSLANTFGSIGKGKKPKGKMDFAFDGFYQMQC